MSTVERPLADFDAFLGKSGQQLTGSERVMKEMRVIAPRDGDERDEKALAFASRLAESLLADLAPREIPVLWETIAPQEEDWLGLMELCGGSANEAEMGIPKTGEEQVIAGAFFNHNAQQAAFMLGVAIGQRLLLNAEKEQ